MTSVSEAIAAVSLKANYLRQTIKVILGSELTLSADNINDLSTCSQELEEVERILESCVTASLSLEVVGRKLDEVTSKITKVEEIALSIH